jgi:hypothetical protein
MDFRLTCAVILWVAIFSVALFQLIAKPEYAERVWWRSFILFAVLLAIAFPVWRLRSMMYNGEINVDESQFLAQLLRYKIDPIPWRGVDGGSSGPLNTWVISWAPIFGLKIDYFAARVTGLLCLWFMCCGLALSISEIVGRRIALILATPAITLLLTTLNLDYVYFSSEQLPIALFAWSIYFLTLQGKRLNRRFAYFIGFLT